MRLILIALFLMPLFTSLAFAEADFKNGAESFQRVKEMLLKEHYNTGLTADELYRAATDGMLRALNSNGADWNKLLAPADLREIQNDLKGEIAGIGAEIAMENESGIAKVLGVIRESPAEKAGIQPGDQIISIDGKLLKGMELRDVVFAIRGKIGEKVTLKLLRGDNLISKSVERGRVAWVPVEHAMVTGNVGWLLVRSFNEKTPELVKQALSSLQRAGLKRLVIDMRGNPGGALDKAVDCAALFLPKGAIVVRIEGRNGVSEERKTGEAGMVSGIPIAILVDRDTSSGGELFAASLHENIGAKLIGSRTHGKWNAQKLETLSNGYAIKFTTKLFRSPKGNTFQDKGLEPEIRVVPESEDEGRALARIKDPAKRLAQDAAFKAAVQVLTQ